MSDFLLPDIGEGIVECEVVEWRVAEGDQIEEDQPIVEVMTDKALVEITAHEAGVVTKLYVGQRCPPTGKYPPAPRCEDWCESISSI